MYGPHVFVCARARGASQKEKEKKKRKVLGKGMGATEKRLVGEAKMN
jgi:hypothetical protein